MYCLEVIKFDVSNISYYVENVETENVALLRDVVRLSKIILGGHGNFLEDKVWEP